MASTRGRKPLPLPVSLADGLKALGYVTKWGDDQAWVHPKVEGVELRIVSSNIPGSQMVLYSRQGRTERVDPDLVLAEATLISKQYAGHRIMERPS